MAKETPEQNLIDGFVEALKKQNDPTIKIRKLINMNCQAKKWANIEFISHTGELWVIEAKSHKSSDQYNTTYKIFGKLLKETGRERAGKCNYAVLLPEDGKDFYSCRFQLIDRKKFVAFGKLIPVECIFTFGDSGISRIGWEEFYNLPCSKK